MALPTNTFTTYSAVGLREQLSDTIYNITPDETPLLSRTPKRKVSGKFNEWQLDALQAPDAANAQLEGDDAAFTAITPTTRVGNYQQISRKAIVLADSEEEVEKAGRKSELAYQSAMRGVELRRDMETIMFGSNQAAVAGAAGTARKTGSILAWLRTNTVEGVGGVDPVAPNPAPLGARTDGTLANITEAMVTTLASSLWTAGANFGRIKAYVGATVKSKMSAFAGVATHQVQINKAAPTSIVASADVYVSEFGNIEFIPSRLQRARDALFLDFSLLQVDTLRPFKRVPLAKTGDNTKWMLIVEYGLRVKNEAGMGAIYDVQ